MLGLSSKELYLGQGAGNCTLTTATSMAKSHSHSAAREQQGLRQAASQMQPPTRTGNCFHDATAPPWPWPPHTDCTTAEKQRTGRSIGNIGRASSWMALAGVRGKLFLHPYHRCTPKATWLASDQSWLFQPTALKRLPAPALDYSILNSTFVIVAKKFTRGYLWIFKFIFNVST